MNIWKNFDKHLEYRRKLEKNLNISGVRSSKKIEIVIKVDNDVQLNVNIVK